MNYYKLSPLEYKNSIFPVLALSLSPDKGMALRKRSWYVNGRGCRLALGSREGNVLWRESAEPPPGPGCLGIRNLALASKGCSLVLKEVWGLISILFSRIRNFKDLEAVRSELILSSHQPPTWRWQVPGKVGPRVEGVDSLPSSPGRGGHGGREDIWGQRHAAKSHLGQSSASQTCLYITITLGGGGRGG